MAATADSAAVQLRHHICRRCGFGFSTPVYQRRLCTDCQAVPHRQRAPGYTRQSARSSEPYRWAHAVTMQRLAIELARAGLRTALLGTYDGPKLEQAVKQALADLDAVIDPNASHTVGARRAA